MMIQRKTDQYSTGSRISIENYTFECTGLIAPECLPVSQSFLRVKVYTFRGEESEFVLSFLARLPLAAESPEREI